MTDNVVQPGEGVIYHQYCNQPLEGEKTLVLLFILSFSLCVAAKWLSSFILLLEIFKICKEMLMCINNYENPYSSR